MIEAFAYAGEQRLPIVTAVVRDRPARRSRRRRIDQAFADIFDAYPDTLYVVAAGNEGADIDETPGLPLLDQRPGTAPDSRTCSASG